MVSKRSLILGLGALGMIATLGTAGVVAAQTPPAPPPPAAQGWGPGYGCWGGGPGMMRGWGGGPGMMRGWGGGPGMQQGWGGGPGMQQGWGPGPSGGPGMQQGWQQGWGGGPGGGPGMMRGHWQGRRGGPAAALAADGEVTADEVQKMMEWRVTRRNNPNLKVGKVEVKDDSVITAQIVTKEGSLVREYEIDRKTGQMRPVQ